MSRRPTPQADSAPLAAPADTVVLEAALRAIHQAIDLIGEPDTERLRTVRRVLRGAVVVAEDSTAPQADSQPAGADRHGLPPLPDPDLRDVGTTPGGIKEFLRGYATEYAKAALASSAPADSVLEDAAQVEIDLFNDLNRIYGNTLTAYAKELCRLGYRKTNAARKQGANHD
jgi:hypothetical protein